jgi:hypothetical protein
MTRLMRAAHVVELPVPPRSSRGSGGQGSYQTGEAQARSCVVRG